MQKEVWYAPQESFWWYYTGIHGQQTREITEASKNDIDVLFEALPLDWETMCPPPAPLIPAIGEPYPFSAHEIKSKERKRKYCQLNWNLGEKIQ